MSWAHWALHVSKYSTCRNSRERDIRQRQRQHLKATSKELVRHFRHRLIREGNWNLKHYFAERKTHQACFVNVLEHNKNWLIGLVFKSLRTYLSNDLDAVDLGKTRSANKSFFNLVCNRILGSWIVKVSPLQPPSNEKHVNNGIILRMVSSDS